MGGGKRTRTAEEGRGATEVRRGGILERVTRVCGSIILLSARRPGESERVTRAGSPPRGKDKTLLAPTILLSAEILNSSPSDTSL